MTSLLRRFAATRYGSAGLAIMLALVLVALLDPWIVPFGPRQQVGTSLLPPSLAFPMGTDNIGRDLFSLVLSAHAPRWRSASAAALAALLIGGTVGVTGRLLARRRRGRADAHHRAVPDVAGHHRRAVRHRAVRLELLAADRAPSRWRSGRWRRG